MRAALYTLRLVSARLSRRNGGVVLVVLGLAAGAAVLLGGRAGSLLAQDRAVGQAVERIDEGSRSVRAVWFGLPGRGDEPWPRLDERARAAIAEAVDVEANALVLFRETTIAGEFAGLGGVERLGDWVTVRSGRLPQRCTPARCEVLRLRGQGGLPQPAGIELVEVGEAVLDGRVLFGDFLAPTDNALADAEVSPSFARAAGYHRPPPAPLFLAEGVEALAGLPSLDPIYRSYAWVAPLSAGTPRLWEVDGLAAGVARARSQLQGITSSFDVVAPVEELREAQATSRAAGRRLGIVGGEAAALLFAFALLAALTLRTDLAAARRRLAWYGARGWQLALLTVTEAAALATAGTALGLSVAAAVAAVATDGDVLARSVLSGEGLALAAAVAAAGTAILVAAVTSRGPAARAADVLAAGALLLVALELSREGESDLTLLVPGLVAFAAAVAVARVLPPVLRLLARGGRLAPRLAAVSLARAPGYAVVATAFLVVSFGLALFAEAYRSTLARGDRDQAAHRVPLDYRLREDLRRLVPVGDAAPPERYEALGVDPSPVLRVTGSVARLEGESGITLLGVPPEADERVPDAGGELAGAILPRSLTRFRVEARGDPVRLFAEIEAPNGRFHQVEAGEAIPPAARGGRLAGIVLRPATRVIERGADAGQAVRGAVEISLPDLPGALAGWRGYGGAELEGAAIRYTLGNDVVTRIRPVQAVDGEPVPVLATPRLAAAAGTGGLLPLQIAGERLTVRVVETVPRFPGVDGQAVVGDVEALTAAVNLARPGAGRVNEVWLSLRDPSRADAVDAALAEPPFHVLTVESRRALEAEAREDPIAQGTLLALAIAAAAALALALGGILLTVVGDLRDERGELFDLEAQGAAPALLRRIVRLRAAFVAAAGLAAGALTGVALAAVVTDLVGLTSRATAAEPPLALDIDLGVVGLAAAAYVALAALLVGPATRRAFSAAAPGRVEAVE